LGRPQIAGNHAADTLAIRATFGNGFSANSPPLGAKINVIGIGFLFFTRTRKSCGTGLCFGRLAYQFTARPAFQQAAAGEQYPRERLPYRLRHPLADRTLLSVLCLTDKQCIDGPRTRCTGADALSLAV